jgi:murein DD-endopeptidase MepM/ murein hydrolase activator NlpD
MAVVVKPSKSLLNIRSGIKSIKDSFSGLRKNAGNLNDVVLKKTKVKRESIARNAILSQRRKEDERRKAKEDLLEASTIGGAVKRQAKAVASSTKGFLGRIMDFVGTLLVGWLLTNLPSIITMAQELIARIQRLYTIVTGFFDNTIKMFRGFGDLLGAVSKNILTFDFMDSKGRVDGALKDLGGTFEDMQKQFDEGFKLLTTSLGEGVVSGEDAAPFGTQYENESMQQQPSGSSGGGGTFGTKEQRAMLDAISYAEGTKKSYGTIYGGKVVPELERGELTVGQVLEMQKTGMLNGKSVGYAKDRYNSDATGRYQFMSYTLREEIGKQGISLNEKFTPALQDKIILNRITKLRGVTPELLKKEGLSAKVSNMLSPEFASLPTYSGASYYGQPVKSLKSIQNAYQQSLGSQSTSTSQTTPIPSQSPARGISTTVRDEIDVVRNKSPLAGLTPGQGFGAARRGGRIHEGIDIGTYNTRGFYVSFRSSGKVVFAGVAGGYGNTVDIVTSDGTCYRFAHLAKMMVRNGESYNGQTIGEIGNTGSGSGIHLHFEVRPGGPYGKAINPKPYLGLLSIGRQLTGLAGQPVQVAAPSPTPAQITPSGTQQRQQTSQQLAQQQAGPSIIIIEEEPPAPQQQGSVGGGGAMMIPIVINPLNSFITKKLLLDLAYT